MHCSGEQNTIMAVPLAMTFARWRQLFAPYRMQISKHHWQLTKLFVRSEASSQMLMLIRYREC
jgi:hypothetical protein